MDRTAATGLLEAVFSAGFDRERFARLAREMLNGYEPAPFALQGHYIRETFRESIRRYERLGKYTDPDGKKLDILIVELETARQLEVARTRQRNFVADYLKHRDEKDAALVAFTAPGVANWRLSLVKMEYHLREGGVAAEFTPARRWSFLVGEGEQTHTAGRQLLPLLEDDDQRPTLARLETAFGVETITAEFFHRYRELFFGVMDGLTRIMKTDRTVADDFRAKNVDPVNFVKKLLGQIVFLYFVQRKGWLGVPVDQHWGAGDRRFLRTLFDRCREQKENYYNDFLEYLFYDALNNEQRGGADSSVYPRFNCKIPFLNGGLFETINNYDWEKTRLTLPNELFANAERSAAGDCGTGILDVFDRFNFTVQEDEPLDKEVAIDPEFLGKIFEQLNAITSENYAEYRRAVATGKKGEESKFNKKNGVYYTPREIVQYMCQESLGNYLLTGMGGRLSREELSNFVRYGEQLIEWERLAVEKRRENPRYKGDYTVVLKKIESCAAELDRWLEKVTVCDPAVGSGAFLVGMMSEIVKARRLLAQYLGHPSGSILYEFKRHAISHSLYGVDIDPGAVEIAKLRLWLSLIVDENDFQTIQPLPNLDFKVMQGNSLLEEYEGIKLFDPRLLEATVDIHTEAIADLEARRDRLARQIMPYYRKDPRLMADRKKKRPLDLIKLERELDSLKRRLDARRLPAGEQDGFNLETILSTRDIWERLKELHHRFFSTHHKSTKDKLKAQIEALNWQLIEATLTEQGKPALLAKVAAFKAANVKPFFLWRLHFSEVFQNGGFAIVIANPPYVLLQNKNINSSFRPIYAAKFVVAAYKIDLYHLFIEQGIRLLAPNGVLVYITPANFLSNNYAVALRRFLLEETALRQIITFEDDVFEASVNNVVFTVQKAKKAQTLFLKGTISTNGLQLTPGREIPQTDFCHGDYLLIPSGSQELSNIITKLSLQKFTLGMIASVKFGMQLRDREKYPRDVLVGDTYKKQLSKDHRPCYTGRDISRWIVAFQDRYCYFNQIAKRGGCWDESIHNAKNKILIKQIGNYPEAAIDGKGYAVLNTAFMIIPTTNDIRPKYLLGVLNSSAVRCYWTNKFKDDRTTFPKIKGGYLEQIPIPVAPKDTQDSIISLVDAIVAAKQRDPQADTAALEVKIDTIVYQLYGLSPDEIALITSDAEIA